MLTDRRSARRSSRPGRWARPGGNGVQVRVRLYGEYSKYAGKAEWVLDVAEGVDLRGVLAAFDEQSGKPISKSLLLSEQTIFPSVAIMVNGGNVLMKDGLRTQLGDGDQLTVMPMIGGGAD
jgi:molybdopterin converting factor small subunit